MRRRSVPKVVARKAGGETRGVVLVFYGGKAKSRARSRPWHLSAARLVPFARAIHRSGSKDGIATWTLRYRVRGWNDNGENPGEGGGQASPVADAEWALGEIERRHGAVPVVLVGHSMGGRVALRVAGHPMVQGVVALAPWLNGDEPVDQLTGKRVLIIHGTADTWTSPKESLDFATRLLDLGVDVHRFELPDLGHSMLRRASLWHGLTTLTALRWLADALSEPSNSRFDPNTGGKPATPMRLRIRA